MIIVMTFKDLYSIYRVDVTSKGYLTLLPIPPKASPFYRAFTDIIHNIVTAINSAI